MCTELFEILEIENLKMGMDEVDNINLGILQLKKWLFGNEHLEIENVKV